MLEGEIEKKSRKQAVDPSVRRTVRRRGRKDEKLGRGKGVDERSDGVKCKGAQQAGVKAASSIPNKGETQRENKEFRKLQL